MGGTDSGNGGDVEVQQDNRQEFSVVRPLRATESGILHSKKKLSFVCIFETSPIWLLSLDKNIIEKIKPPYTRAYIFTDQVLQAAYF